VGAITKAKEDPLQILDVDNQMVRKQQLEQLDRMLSEILCLQPLKNILKQTQKKLAARNTS
jgi:hypothetical protein